MQTDPSLPVLLGGAPVFAQGPPAWPAPDPGVFDALQRAYHDGSWGQYHGRNTAELEATLRQFHALDHVVLCGSGTFAVELALRSLRVGAGDEVLVAAYDYPGNFLAIHAVGAHPVLVDLDPDHWNMSAKALANASGPNTKAVLASHLHGGCVDMARVLEVARAHNLAVIEDAAQAPGAVVQGRRAGTWGDAATLSFGGSKLVSAGRGGALLTPHAAVAQRARTHLLRGNLTCPLSELQAAVVLPQWQQLDARNERRLENVRRLEASLADIPGVRPLRNRLDASKPAYYKFAVQFDAGAFGLDRDRLVAALRAEGVAAGEGFAAAHIGRSPRRFRRVGNLAEAERAHQGCVVLHHPVLLNTAAEIDAVARAWHKLHAHAARLRAVPET